MLAGWVLRGGCIIMLILRPLPPPPPAHQPDPVQGFHLLKGRFLYNGMVPFNLKLLFKLY